MTRSRFPAVASLALLVAACTGTRSGPTAAPTADAPTTGPPPAESPALAPGAIGIAGVEYAEVIVRQG